MRNAIPHECWPPGTITAVSLLEIRARNFSERPSHLSLVPVLSPFVFCTTPLSFYRLSVFVLLCRPNLSEIFESAIGLDLACNIIFTLFIRNCEIIKYSTKFQPFSHTLHGISFTKIFPETETFQSSQVHTSLMFFYTFSYNHPLQLILSN